MPALDRDEDYDTRYGASRECDARARRAARRRRVHVWIDPTWRRSTFPASAPRHGRHVARAPHRAPSGGSRRPPVPAGYLVTSTPGAPS